MYRSDFCCLYAGNCVGLPPQGAFVAKLLSEDDALIWIYWLSIDAFQVAYVHFCSTVIHFCADVSLYSRRLRKTTFSVCKNMYVAIQNAIRRLIQFALYIYWLFHLEKVLHYCVTVFNSLFSSFASFCVTSSPLMEYINDTRSTELPSRSHVLTQLMNPFDSPRLIGVINH